MYPAALRSARWNALDGWYTDHGHFFVSNGPFYLESIDTVAKTITVKAFRDYVYKANRWDSLVTPKIPEITTEIPSPIVVVPGLTVTIPITSTLEGVPYSDVDIKFILMDSEGNVALEKTPTWDEATHAFKVVLTEEELGLLPLGTYTAYVVAIPKEAAVPKVISKSVIIVPVMVYVEARMSAMNATLSSQIAELESTVSDLEAQLAAARASARTAMYAGVGVGVIGIAIAAVAIALAKKS